MKVVLHVEVDMDGTVFIGLNLSKTIGTSGIEPSFVRAVEESAKRAIYRASPLQNLPADKYNNWKEFQFTFDPSPNDRLEFV